MSSRTAACMAGQLGWALCCVVVRLAGSASSGASAASERLGAIHGSNGLLLALRSLLCLHISICFVLTLAMFPLLAGTWMWITMWAWRQLGGMALAATDRWPPEQAPPARRCGNPLLSAAHGW